MKPTLLPALWLITIIVGLPILSETIYTPSLPDIAKSLAVSSEEVEFTLTIYLFGFAIGTLFWGRLSDNFGRKPCLLLGLGGYILGCLGCYFSDSITMLLFSRFVQAFGGSTGSVLGQAICRDAFHGTERAKIYSIIGSALALSPALGPIMGGIIDQLFGWSVIFMLLSVIGLMVLIITYFKLTETHTNRHSNNKQSIFKLLRQMSTDKRVLAFGFLVGACNGLSFSYYAEGSFYLIDLLGLSPAMYGASFITIAFAGVIGGWLSHMLHKNFTANEILQYGIVTLLLGAATFVLLLSNFIFLETGRMPLIVVTLLSMLIITLGISLIIPNTLSQALNAYQHCVGTASSLFGFFYYLLISLFTLGMGLLHNDTLFPMPIYFFGIGILIWLVFVLFIKQGKQ